MSATFVDTAFLLALVIEDDELHERAVMWDAALTDSCITTEFILLELADALCSPELRGAAIDLIDHIRQDPLIEIVPADANLLESGYQLFCDRLDKGWSLTDCISFRVMLDRGITDALTHDHHFEQAKFRALLRGDPPGN